MDFGDDDKYGAMGLETNSFQMESKGLLEVKDVLYVTWINKNLLPI